MGGELDGLNLRDFPSRSSILVADDRFRSCVLHVSIATPRRGAFGLAMFDPPTLQTVINHRIVSFHGILLS